MHKTKNGHISNIFKLQYHIKKEKEKRREEKRREEKRKRRRKRKRKRSTMAITDAEDHEHNNKKPAFSLVGCKNFVRKNPFSDRFPVHTFHHIEFWCGDASNTWRRFSWGLGMSPIAKSDQSTGNQRYCSYALRSNDLVFAFSAPYSDTISQDPGVTSISRIPHPGWDSGVCRSFFNSHGLAARAVGVLVDDAKHAFEMSVAHGAIPALLPHTVLEDDGSPSGPGAIISEVKLYGDVVLRYVCIYGYVYVCVHVYIYDMYIHTPHVCGIL